MIAQTYTLLFGVALLLTVGLLADIGPTEMVGILVVVLWLALLPSSFAVERITSSGNIETISQPVLAFVCVAGLGLTALLTFEAIIHRLSGGRRDGQRVIQEVLGR